MRELGISQPPPRAQAGVRACGGGRSSRFQAPILGRVIPNSEFTRELEPLVTRDVFHTT